MSTDYKPGTVAVATVRGVPDVRIMATSGPEWVTERGYSVSDRDGDTTGHVTDVCPLVVIDMTANNPDFRDGVLNALRGAGCYNLAEQIAEQTRPPRIPEPGLWGVVEASCCHGDRRITFVHGQRGWNATEDRSEPDCWEDLIDPVLIREGVPA